MRYLPFQEAELSILGMGNMRLPTVGDDRGAPIDEEKAQEIIDYVYSHGVNYYDTAYMYHGGKSECFIGKALRKYPRDSYYLADKMPGWDVKQPEDVPAIFEEQLRRCGVDYFDFYLLHNMSDGSFPIYIDPKMGVVDYLLEQKRAGRIHHLGFSSHATPEMLEDFLNRYPDTFEFVQIQLNYLDWTLQDARRQYEIITAHGLKVWVMEPCRGGRLASLCPEADAMLKEAEPEQSIASWAFRFVRTLPEVQVVLSGMSTLEQAADNVATFSNLEPLSQEELDTLWSAFDLFHRTVNVPCTKCHYCDGCPVGLDIPDLLALYNDISVYDSGSAHRKVRELTEDKLPSRCVACGRCARLCPQRIDIPGALKKFAVICDADRA